MAKSKADAAMLLLSMKSGLIPVQALDTLKFLSGADRTKCHTDDETIRILERLGIARKDKNLLDGSDVLILLPYGKKVIAVMQENRGDFI